MTAFVKALGILLNSLYYWSIFVGVLGVCQEVGH